MRHERPRSPVPRCARGFTLAELAIVLIVVSLIFGGAVMSLFALRQTVSLRETQRQVADIREALLGFASANGRLPCPASAASAGAESFCTADTGTCGAIVIPTPGSPAIPAHGRCSHPYDGFLPGATLGLSGLDASGYPLDAWGTSANRFRYAVADTTINGVGHVFTRPNGIKSATIAQIATSGVPFLTLCASSAGINGNSCAAGASLTGAAIAVVISLGRNAPNGARGDDEAENLDGDALFVSHAPATTGSAGGEFDDIVFWLSPNVLFSRMIAAGRLP